MLYAIIVTGDKQFRVEKGLILEIPLIEEAEENSTITFDKVLLCSNGEETAVGAPLVEGALVKATCLGESKGDKLFVFKIKKRKKYRKKTNLPRLKSMKSFPRLKTTLLLIRLNLKRLNLKLLTKLAKLNYLM